MTRTRRLILAVGVACVGTTVLLLAQANKPSWTARIGSPGEKALAITKPIVLTAEPWPKGAKVAGTVMILHDREETLRLPRDVKKLGLSSNDAVAMIGIYCDGDATTDVVVSFQTSTRMFKPFFDVLPRLGKVIEKDDLIALWPRIEAFNKQTDEAKFLSALEFTRQKYDKSAADPVAAAIAYNALKFRSNFGLFDDVQVLKMDSGGNRIYAHSQGGGMDWRLWVFGRDGSFLGEVTCRKEYRDTALGVAQSMRTRVATRLRGPATRRAENTKQPTLPPVPRTSVERVRQIALAIHLYYYQYEKWPSTLQELVDRRFVAQGALVNPKTKKAKTPGHIYVRPKKLMDKWENTAPVMLYEAFDRWPTDGIAVGFADGAVTTIKKEADFKRALEYCNGVWEK